MDTTQILLFALVVLCTLAAAVLGVLWHLGKDARRNAELLAADREQRCRQAEAAAREIEARLKRALDAIDTLKATNAAKSEEAQQLIAQWESRYRRIAQWEGVQDLFEKEQSFKQTVTTLERTVEALRNVIDGYGSRYVVPPQTMLDELARETAHAPAGQQLKLAREHSRNLVREGRAAASDYADGARAELAANFALDAFNGKAEAILGAVKSDNVGTLQQKILDAFTLVNEQGEAFRRARITKEYLDARLAELKWAALVQKLKMDEREEQRAVKERMREEAKVQREIERAQRDAKKQEETLQRERKLIEETQARAAAEQRALYEAQLREELARATESERAAVEAEFREKMAAQEASQRSEYEARLAEQDARMAAIMAERERAKSMAQQTKRGTVYVISNIGAFGERVFKIGQTRRLDPMDRIWELGDASVPFDFDVHALITTDDAPRLEGILHEQFALYQVNKMNWRKEFFRLDLSDIQQVVDQMGITADWTMTAAAQQFRETQALERQLDSDPDFRARWLEEQRGLDFADASSTRGTNDVDDESAE
jgi:hypothetical protein